MKSTHPPVVGCRGHDHLPDTSTPMTRVVDNVRFFRQRTAQINNVKEAFDRMKRATSIATLSMAEAARNFAQPRIRRKP